MIYFRETSNVFGPVKLTSLWRFMGVSDDNVYFNIVWICDFTAEW